MIDVEPIVQSELDRLVPLPDATPDWADVERRARRRRTRTRIHRAALPVVVVVGAVALLAYGLGENGRPSIVERAYGAISGRSGVMHFVVTYSGTGPTRPYYEEYWLDLAHPSRQRVVQSAGGKVFGQIVYVGGYRRIFSLSRRDQHGVTVVTHAPPPPPPRCGDNPSTRGLNPILGYRQMLRTCRVVSQEEITYHGKRAYKLAILLDEGAGNVIYAKSRITYIVDRRTYYPLVYAATSWEYGRGTWTSVTRYLKFEILPPSREAEALLKPAAHPQPFVPRRSEPLTDTRVRDTVSNRGRRIASELPGQVYLLGIRGEVAFYRIEGIGRGTCYRTGSARTIGRRFGVGGCDAAFPSPAKPVFVFTGVSATRDHNGTIFVLVGFAADEVERVELRSATGTVLASAPVRENIFALPAVEGQRVRGAKLVFRDRHGSQVYVDRY